MTNELINKIKQKMQRLLFLQLKNSNSLLPLPNRAINQNFTGKLEFRLRDMISGSRKSRSRQSITTKSKK